MIELPINFTVPELSVDTNSSKDTIIYVLSNDWPLTVTQINNRISDLYGLNISYQAVHKTLLQLELDNIVLRKGKKFELKKSWIKNLKNFATTLENRYILNERKKNIKYKGKPITLKFDDMNDFFREFLSLLGSNQLIQNNNRAIYAIQTHGWFPLGFRFSDYNLLSKLVKSNKKGVWCVIQKELPFDKVVAQTYKRAGLNVLTGIKDDAFKHGVIAQGDFVFDINFSPATTELVEELYSKTQNLSVYFREFTKQFTEKKDVNIKIKIRKNPSYAKLLQKQVLSHFKEEEQND